MLSSRLFRKLYIACAGLNLLAAAIIGSAISTRQQDWFLSEIASGTDSPEGNRHAADISNQLGARIRGAKMSVWATTLIVELLILSALWWWIREIVRPIIALQGAADAVSDGDYRQRVYISNRDELGQLARSFNRMSQELDHRMSQLLQSSERQATVLGGMVEGVIAVNERERILFANAAAGRLYNFPPSTVVGRPLLEVVRQHALHEAVGHALSRRRPQRLETVWDAAGQLTVAIQATPLPGDPCPGVVLVLHDITELRRLESLRQEFVANVSHELKTPLSSIKAYAETLQNGAIHDQKNSLKFIGRIEEQADRLHHLILDMLTLARIESDQQAFDIVSVRLTDVVSDCMDDNRAAAATKEIELQWSTEEPDLQVQSDREGLREILNNLVDNAIKYTPTRGRVTVRWKSQGTMACLEVQDTGIGISDEHLARVFERFYRVDKARSREMGGTGLGLAIVKHLVQSFGGHVGVESRRAQGTTFLVYLPLP